MLDNLQTGMNWLDYAVILAYILITIGIGLYFRKSASKSMESFYLGGRRMPGWANGFSYAAACLNSDVAPAYVAWTVGTGLFVAWLYLSRFGLAFMIGGILFALFWRRLNLFTSPEFYELRFSGRLGSTLRVWIGFRSAFIAIVAWSGAGLLGLSKVTGPVFDWSKTQTIMVVIPAVMVYVFASGYIGVVTTDIFQSLIIFIGSLSLAIFVLIDFHGPSGLARAVEQAFPSGNVAAEILGVIPPLGHAELGWTAIFAWIIGTGLGYGGDVAPMGGAMEGQRILSSRSEREAAKMYIWTEVILFILLVVITLPGLGALAHWPELHTAERGVRENAFGMLLQHYMPHGFLGLAIAALMASLMSTLSANFNFGAQVATNDVYRRLIKRDAPDKHYLFVSKIFLAVICILSIYVAIKAESLITIAVFMLGLSSAELSANWAQWWWWRFNSAGRMSASFGGPLIFLAVRLGLSRYLESNHGIMLSEWDAILLSVALTTVLWVTVTLLTPPQDRKTLVEFYQRARPLGLWGPIRRECGLPANGSDVVLILRGFMIALLGAVWIGLVILGISNLYVGAVAGGLALCIAGLAGGLLFYHAFQSYMRRLDERNSTA